MKPDEYWNTPTQCAWKGWQLAKAEAAERERALVAEVERLKDENEGLVGTIALGIETLEKYRGYALAQHESKEASDA